MKAFLALTLFAAVLGHQDYDFNKWARNKAMESCIGEENMKIWTVQMKKAVSKCSQQDAPELLLQQFRAPYKTVNALLEASDDMENTDMQMMFNMFRFMHKMQQSQNQHRNSNNQFRPYSQDQDMSDNMPTPMKWMMKMMMKNMNQGQDSHSNNYDVMKMRTNDHMESRMDKVEALLKNAYHSKMNKENSYNNMKSSSNNNNMAQLLYSNLFEMNDNNMDYGNMFHKRQARSAENKLDLGDRLVEKLQRQKQEMEEKVGNMTCLLKELTVLDSNNDIAPAAVKKVAEGYNQWFKENHDTLVDTCYSMVNTLPADLEDGYIVEGDFGKVNMAKVKMFMSCLHKGKAKICMNQDIKQKIELNFGPLADILEESKLTENQLFPLVQDLLHGQESELDDLF